MSTFVPFQPKIYHIVHVDRLTSIISAGALFSDARVAGTQFGGTTIGMAGIKAICLRKHLRSHPELAVGECVPFYFCPRSVMLYVIARRNAEGLSYRDGEDPIVHLEADFHQAMEWANANGLRWAFTTQNAASAASLDFADLGQLNQIDWDAVTTDSWSHVKDQKQAEFLVEDRFPWGLVSRIGCRTRRTAAIVARALTPGTFGPSVHIQPDWYYNFDDRSGR